MKIVEVYDEKIVSELHIEDDVWNNMTEDEQVDLLNDMQNDDTSSYPVPDNGGEFEVGEGYMAYEVSDGKCCFCDNKAVYGMYPDVDYIAQEVLLCQHHWFENVCD